MCLQDIRIGRRSFKRSSFTLAAGATATIPADASRVAVLLTYNGSTTLYGISSLRLSGAASVSECIAAIGGGQPHGCFRVEDYGLVITEQLTVVNNDAGLNLFVATVYYDDNGGLEQPMKY